MAPQTAILPSSPPPHIPSNPCKRIASLHHASPPSPLEISIPPALHSTPDDEATLDIPPSALQHLREELAKAFDESGALHNELRTGFKFGEDRKVPAQCLADTLSGRPMSVEEVMALRSPLTGTVGAVGCMNLDFVKDDFVPERSIRGRQKQAKSQDENENVQDEKQKPVKEKVGLTDEPWVRVSETLVSACRRKPVCSNSIDDEWEVCGEEAMGRPSSLEDWDSQVEEKKYLICKYIL